MTGSANQRPICVDLDGTLIQSDVLAESLLIACRSWATLSAIPRFALKGKAGLKAELAKACHVACDLLPYDRELIDFLRLKKSSGRPLILVTGTNIAVARRINEHLDFLFDDVMGSDDQHNLRGANKATALVERFGERGFTYLGNDATDLKVWAKAASAIIVGASDSLIQRAELVVPIERIFGHRAHPLRALVQGLKLQHWAKNALVFVAPIVAAPMFGLSDSVAANILVAFAAFCAVASATYLLGDCVRLDDDRRAKRDVPSPVANGALPIPWAIVAAVCLLSAGTALAAWSGILAFVAAYAAVSIVYAGWFRSSPLAGMFVLVVQYWIRLLAGSVAAGLPLPSWLFVPATIVFCALAWIESNGIRRLPAQNGARGASHISAP